jgi:hypothetical protein
MNDILIDDIYEDLSVRAKNLIINIGNVEKALKHYHLNGNFYAFKNVGKTTNNELIDFFSFITNKSNFSNSEFLNNEVVKLKHSSIVYDYYLELKRSLTRKLLLTLRSFEVKHLMNMTESDKHIFLNKLLNNKDKLISNKAIGNKSTDKLIKLITEIIEFNNKFDVYEIELDLNKDLLRTLRGLLKNNFILEVRLYFIDNHVSLFKLSFVLIRRSLNKISLFNAFDFLYQEKERKENKEIGEILNLTTERVRQINKKFENNVIPDLINELLLKINKEEIFEFTVINETNWYTNINSINYDFELNDVWFKPNIYFKKIFVRTLFEKHFTILEDLLDGILYSNRVFDVSNCCFVIIKKEAIVEYKISYLLSFLIEQIYSFEIADFDFDLHVLIRRFYKENSYDMHDSVIERIYEFILSIKRVEIKKSIRISKNLMKQNSINLIYESLLIIFEEHKSSIRTSDLLEYLKDYGCVIDKPALLNVLNNFSEFYKFGADTWLYSRETNPSIVSGNLIHMAIELLKASKVPLHISEFIVEFSKYRPIDDRSLFTNFRISKRFQFFNCGFIGLIGISYLEYFTKLPKVNGSSFLSKNVNRIAKLYNNDLLKGYQELYSYPQIHSLYLLRKNGFL